MTSYSNVCFATVGNIYEVGSTGISSLGGHTEKRTHCVNRFAAEYGLMPLVSTSVKAVDSRKLWFWWRISTLFVILKFHVTARIISIHCLVRVVFIGFIHVPWTIFVLLSTCNKEAISHLKVVVNLWFCKLFLVSIGERKTCVCTAGAP